VGTKFGALLMLKQVAYIVTTALERVKGVKN
jgi:hypothetical protein